VCEVQSWTKENKILYPDPLFSKSWINPVHWDHILSREFIVYISWHPRHFGTIVALQLLRKQGLYNIQYTPIVFQNIQVAVKEKVDSSYRPTVLLIMPFHRTIRKSLWQHYRSKMPIAGFWYVAFNSRLFNLRVFETFNDSFWSILLQFHIGKCTSPNTVKRSGATHMSFPIEYCRRKFEPKIPFYDLNWCETPIRYSTVPSLDIRMTLKRQFREIFDPRFFSTTDYP
jgi:hypothetical protein